MRPLNGRNRGFAYGQARSHAHACPAHRLPMLGANDRARAEVIGHRPTGHASGSRALQGLDDLAAVVIRQPDVEQHMDVIRCRIDVGHHRVDRGVGVRQKARGVALTHAGTMTPGEQALYRKARSAYRAALARRKRELSPTSTRAFYVLRYETMYG
jgi:hypothetical protein